MAYNRLTLDTGQAHLAGRGTLVTLRVDAKVPYGNACDVSVVEEADVTVVSFAPDPHGGPEVLWFCFRLTREGGRKGPAGKVKLVLKNMANILGGSDASAMRPVVAGPDGQWRRLDAGRARELPDGRVNVEWTIDEPSDFVDLAYCYPYGMPEVDALVAETGGFYRADTIGVSQAARRIVRLSNAPGEPESDRAGLYMVARQHSGEVSGSWVLDGFLRHLASLGEKAPLVWSVPLTNIDGVEGGDYGKDNFPYDLNRAWGTPAMRHETLLIQRDMRRWKARCRPVLALDFHSPGACETDGIYGYLVKNEVDFEHFRASKKWAVIFAEALGPDYAAANFSRVARYASRWETPGFSTFCARDLDVCGLTLETPYALSAGGKVVLTRERYCEAGARLAAVVVDNI
jgi:hypothetical protein